jgi:selenocysteine lyase/cysteine desulfurase
VLEAMIRDLRFSNEAPVEHMWNVLEPASRACVASWPGIPGAIEIAITRNASGSNETMIFGLDLKRGDEVIVTTQELSAHVDLVGPACAARDRRQQIKFTVPPPTDDYVVNQFREAITSRTRVIEIAHHEPHRADPSGGQGRDHGARERVEVFVDAHAFAHFPFTRDELGCDYYGTSHHKWLLAPIGTGFLYVRRSKQKSLWPLMAAPASMDENVRKYEEIGTHPAANHNAIAAALTFHRAIGGERKVARLRYLRDRWAKRLMAESSRVRVLTPLDGKQAGGIALFNVDGIDSAKLQGWLWAKHRIITTPIIHAEFRASITPNVTRRSTRSTDSATRCSKRLRAA